MADFAGAVISRELLLLLYFELLGVEKSEKGLKENENEKYFTGV